VRNTEDLFYKDPPPYAVYSLKSELRPDTTAIRRNAYYRMFGLELPQPQSGGSNGAASNGMSAIGMGSSVNYVKPEASNLEFIPTLERFLREAWVGIENVNNRIGANPTDNLAVANLARRLSEMLRDRRQNGTLSREEFFAVAMMSWFHLTVEFDSPIIHDLQAQGNSPVDRLNRIAGKVNFVQHPRNDSYFQLAEPLSRVLTMIETTRLNNPQNVPVLYAPGNTLRRDIETVITHWSIITGHALKTNNVAAPA